MSFAAEDLLAETPDGFEGAVAGLTLPDVIQMNALNRFSGGITVHYRQKTGVIFFRDGEIIHAEQGEEIGEAAFYEILRWPGGKFDLKPKVTTTSFTIREGWKFLLLEACRLVDESRNPRGHEMSPEKRAPGDRGRNGMNSTIAERLSHIPGVEQATLLTKDGTPVEDSGYEAETLAARAIYLAMIGDRLGDIFGIGNVKAAALHGATQHLLLFESKSHYLSIAVNGASQPGVVEAEVRKALSPKK
jgi:predicted regulator of Ras-like GTPase activity (Roadblock/LC7/MglB family)